MDVKRIADYVLCFGANLMIPVQPLEQVMIHFSYLKPRWDISNPIHGIVADVIKEEIKITLNYDYFT